MISSFILHSDSKSVNYEEAQYLILLLEAFINLTFSDYGIETLLGKEAIKNFTKILDNAEIKQALDDKWQKIAELSLRVLGNMSINHEGKQECIDEKVIERSHAFLIDEPDRSYEDALNTSLILMSCSIHLEGKNQIVHADHHGSPYIIKTMIQRLECDDEEFGDLRKNLKVALINVAELPLGFEKITECLITKIQILDEVF